MKLCSALHIYIPMPTKITEHSSIYFQDTWQQCIKYNHGCKLALCSYTQRWKIMKWCLSSSEVHRLFFHVSVHITRSAEGKVNKLCPAAGTQSRGTSSCWGWVSSSRLVTRNAEPSDRHFVLIPENPSAPREAPRSQGLHHRVLQSCSGLSLELGTSQFCFSILLSVLSCAVSQCSEQARLLRPGTQLYLQGTSDESLCWWSSL